MQLKHGSESVLLVIVLLLLIASVSAVVFYVMLPLPSAKLAGWFSLTIGLLNVAFHRGTGRDMFARGQSSWSYVSSFWVRVGENGTQLLYLGIGIILAVGGLIVLVAGDA